MGGWTIMAALAAVMIEPSFGKTILLSAMSATASTPVGVVQTCVVGAPSRVRRPKSRRPIIVLSQRKVSESM